MRKEKGITLIALIITIIVLLILAGVTINLTLGENGIFKTAGLATKNYTNAQEKELADLAEFTNTVNDIIKGEEKVQLVTEITINKTTRSFDIGGTDQLTVAIEPNNATNKNIKWTSSDESIATVENGKVTAIKLGKATITATTEDGSNISTSCDVKVKNRLSPGDYVEYDGGNGYTGLWQVLCNDSTYGLQIISADTVTDSFTLGGSTEADAKASYNNAVNTLNTECRKYVNSSYATSGRCVGSNPLSPDDPENMATSTLQFTYNGTEDSGCKVGDNDYTTDYDAMKAATSQNTKGIYNLNKYYWLASRRSAYAIKYNCFGIYVVTSKGIASDRRLWEVRASGDQNPFSYTLGLRPVITLKSGIQTSSGDGSESSPYKLVTQ